jgi:hypothetical protein
MFEKRTIFCAYGNPTTIPQLCTSILATISTTLLPRPISKIKLDFITSFPWLLLTKNNLTTAVKPLRTVDNTSLMTKIVLATKRIIDKAVFTGAVLYVISAQKALLTARTAEQDGGQILMTESCIGRQVDRTPPQE